MGWRHGAVVTVAVGEHEQESVMHRRKSGPSAPLVQWLSRGERHWEDAQRGKWPPEQPWLSWGRLSHLGQHCLQGNWHSHSQQPDVPGNILPRLQHLRALQMVLERFRLDAGKHRLLKER